MDEDTFEAAERELKLARDSRNDARVLFDGDGTDSGVLNRLYYATFHAAHATLYVRGLTPSSHGQVRQQFGQHIVLEGDASRRQGRLLSTLYDYRQQADYTGYSPAVDISKLFASVDDFLTHAETLVGSENE